MNNTLFYNWFRLNQFKFNNLHYNDSRQGNSLHYVGYLIGGHAKFVIEQGKTVFASEGDAVFIPREYRYQSYWYGNPVVFESYGFMLFPEKEDINYDFQVFRPNEEQLNLIRQIQKDRTVCCRTIGLLYLLLGSIFPIISVSPDYQYNAIIKKAAEYMRRENCFKVSDVAEYCNVSVSGLYAIFKKSAGLTPIKLKHRILVEKATELLTTTDIPIEEISRKLGFGTSGYFRKIVFDVTGKTPRKIRKSARVGI